MKADPPPDPDPPRVPTPGAPEPPLADDPAAAATRDAFLIRRPLVDAWFRRGSRQLMVTFDNLNSIGQYDPPQPWLLARAQRAGVSILGLIAKRKDWYRNDDAPALILALRNAGLFAQFDRVTFMGSSMGGFAALTYSALVPGSHVLAFSAQSTLSRQVAPFERRYPYAQRKWDWTTPAFLDASAAVPAAASVTLVYDPFDAADKQHARRLDGPNLRHIHADHMGHKAIRGLKEAGGLDELIAGHALGTFDARAFARAARGRRRTLSWQKALLQAAETKGHLRLALKAAKAMQRADPDQRRIRREVARLDALLQAEPALKDEEIHITAGAPKPPFASTIQILRGAIVVPERAGDLKLACGVLSAGRSYCDLSQGWIRARRPFPAPTLAPGEKIDPLPGSYLFGGHFRGHFGHFLVESTARLWALDHVKDRLDGILYLPYRGEVGPTERVMKDHAGFFKALGIDLPLLTFGTPQQVDRLILPELGFGWGERYAGSPAYRAFMMTRLSAAAAPEGGDRLYISRARLPAQRGGVLAEEAIEANLARAGYDIFHPERHPVTEQLARYRAARSVIALDGSALHLAAFVLPRGARVTMILRRSGADTSGYRRQFRGFLGIKPAIIDVVRHDWVAGASDRVDFRSVGELDLPALFDRLKTLGLVPPDFRPDLPTAADLQAQLLSFQDRRGAPFRILGQNEIHPEARGEAP